MVFRRRKQADGQPVPAGPAVVAAPVDASVVPAGPAVAAAPVDAGPVPPEIATLPPLPPPDRPGYPTSPRTGLPRRPAWLAAACAVFAAHVGVIVWCFASFWWLAASVTRLDRANRLFAWAKPDPVSWVTVALVLATVLIAVVSAATWGAVVRSAWHGRPPVRWGVLAGFAATGLTLWLQLDVLSFGLARHLPGFAHRLAWPAAWAGAGLTLAAAVACWLPPFARFSRAMTPPPRPTGARPLDRRPVVYGPQTLIGN